MLPTTACPKCATPLPTSARFCPGCGSTTPTGFTPVDSERESTPTGGAELAARRAEIQKALGSSWELKALIGQGGFGEVWAAFDTKLKRDVAVKTLRADLVASSAMLTRFQREAESVARLRHPHIIPIYQVGEAEGLAFFVMPLVRGSSLQAVLSNEGKLSIDKSRRIIAEAASALHAAHEAGIVHRDIKPENIMLDGDERRVLLMDFGIARAVGSDEGRLTGTGLVIGTPQYMSPEQASADKQIDHRSDIYSLGVVGFQMLAGRHLFDTAAARSLVMHHIATEPPDVRSLRAEVPDDVADAIAKCLKKAPADRWSSAGELAKVMRPTTSSSVTAPSLMRRLRPFARGAKRRSLVYVSAFALVLTATKVALPNIFRDTWRWWFVPVAAEPEMPTSASNADRFRATFEFHGTNRYRSREVQLVSLHDTALIASSPVGGPMIYNGSTWRGIDVPTENWVFPPVEVDGVLWMATEGTFERTVLYAITRAGAIARDTIPARVSSIWSDGKTMLLGSMNGGMLRGRPGDFRRETTGMTRMVMRLIGDSRQQLGLVSGWPLVFNGINWRRTDVRTDTTKLQTFNTANVLRDGSVVAAGCLKARCEGHVWLRDKSTGRWDQTGAVMPPTMNPYGIDGASISDYYVYGAPSEPACITGTCLLHVVKNVVTPVTAVIGDFHVIGVASLRGVPHVLTSSGALWTVRSGEWGVVSDIPSSRLRGVAVAGETRIVWGNGIKVESTWRGLAPRQRSDVRDVVIAGPDVGSQSIWILDERGGLSLIECTRGSGECSAEKHVASPDQRRILDIEASADGSLWVGGERGLLASVRADKWTVLPERDVGNKDVLSVSMRPNRPGFALTETRVLGIDARGNARHWRELGATLGRPRSVIGTPQAGAMVLAEGGAFLLSENATMPVGGGNRGIATSVEVLNDSRLLLGYGLPDDPLVGGTILISRIVKGTAIMESRVVAIPLTMDVLALASTATEFHAVGSGGFWIMAPLEKLPSMK